MSTSEHRSRPCAKPQTRRRKAALNVDLNVPPPGDNREQVGPSSRSQGQDCETNQGVAPMPTAPIDLEALDDDVIISTPSAFAEAKNNSRRNLGRPVVVDIESDRLPQDIHNKRRRTRPSQTVNFFINLEAASNAAPAPPPPPKEPTFNCPVCMGPLVEEMSTKCGHIFCKACIKASIAAQNKCPTCRRKVTMKELIRVYLPAAS
ncbi:OLC1v1006753C1 [Oldenlandia corymbosa var. corymbosa]|uniref:OLC1v1006753C1 n=1 Tax=Oldenlandia corymbosa var. corymbosa TaxID=529605 RepID=A0AAV1DI25_OLDCO|nr:OLC1v1006753C1 [Oldenlandia corymbosa var. corymbosa]